jgi:hypothetical protein
MATKYANIKCKVKWAKPYEPDEFAGAKNWKINAYPVDEAEWDKFEKTGVQLTRKNDEDGEYFVLRRPTQKVIGDNLVVFAPPEIVGKVNVHYVDQDGQKIRQYNKGDKVTVNRVGEPTSIGNESVVLVNFSYYGTSRGVGHRWEGLRVLDLVEFIPTVDTDEEVETPKEEVKASPVKTKTEKKKEEKTISEDLNDSLPW